MTAFLILALACVGAHRIWNFESIFQGLRTALLRWSWAKPITCQVCNAFWIAAALTAGSTWIAHPAMGAALSALAVYPLVRAVLWLYRVASHLETQLRVAAAPARAGRVIVPAVHTVVTPPAAVEPIAPVAGCRDCETKKAALIAAHTQAGTFERRVVLLTPLSDFSPSYSLTTAICDQARMLADNPRWLVQIWVHERANLDGAPKDFPSNVEVRRVVPQVPWTRDAVNVEARDRFAGAIRSQLMALGNATVISHDLLFVADYLTAAAALHLIGSTPGFAWLHVCHSAAGGRPPALSAALRLRMTLPAGHKLLCLNPAERDYLALYYDTPVENVLVCPNARDIAHFGAVDPIARRIIRDFGLAQADVVQVYPVSATRLDDKGVTKIIDVLAHLQVREQLSCRLVLVTAHANGAGEKAALAACRELAAKRGLPAANVVITSELMPETAAQGLSQGVIRDLFAASNLFIFPTVSEASSLVLAEAALSGCLLVTNASLHTIEALVPTHHGLSFRFGSLRQPGDQAPSELVARRIHEALRGSITNTSKRAMMRDFSLATVGARLRHHVESVPLAKL